jgi:alkanesulfonate monooxygenase SsuD/methylene tetrahydromethanopterin reductase-like flavin-dependent oxidoreductase (luciferase family)
MSYRTNIGFDLRAPDFASPAPAIYEATLEMIEYADQHGVEKVDFQEHHQVPDGYLPTPFLMGAAAGVRSKRIDIVLGAVLLPLHDPVKVAEQIAVGDLICDGRLKVVLAAGYNPLEFAAFGVSLHDRARRMDEGLDVILRALSGERFTYEGRPVFVRPLPARPLSEVVFVGGGVPASARRAARLGLGMWPMRNEIIPVYEEECRKLGREPGRIMTIATAVHVTEDPEKGWAEIGKNLLHVARSKASMSTDAAISSSPWHGVDSLAQLKERGMYDVLTPEQTVELAKTRPICVQPLMGGLDPEIGWRCLELFATRCVSQIKANAERALETA